MSEAIPMPLSRLIGRHGLWAPPVAAVAMLGFLAAGGWMVWQERRLDRAGVEAVGRIEAREIVRRRSADSREVIAEPTLTYSFATPDGARREARAVVTGAEYDRLRIGDPVALRSLPADPGVSRLAGAGRSGTGAILLGLAGVMAVLALVALRARWPEAARARRAAAGPRGRARVERVVPLGAADGAPPLGRILWDGGASRPRPRTDLPAEGAMIDLRTDPGSGRQWWERDL